MKRMGSFLDKVGLQHFVEKIKGLLRGYLPLSGGTMTGDIVYTDKATLNGDNLEYTLENTKCLNTANFTANNLTIGYRGNHDTYGFVQSGLARLYFDSLLISVNGNSTLLDTEKCRTPKFVLSGDSSSQGLIANNSETVVPEIASSVIDEVVQNKGAEYTDAGYVSKANLGRLVKNLYDNISTNANNNSTYTIIKTTGIVKITTSDGEVTIPAGINYHIYEDYKITNGKNYVSNLIQSGYAQNGNKYFDGLSNLSSIDVSKLNISNIKDLSFYFRGCSSLYNLNIEYWDTKEVENFAGMFTGCRSLPELRLYFWDTRNVRAMSTMFAGCTNLKTLNLSGWNTQSVNIMSNMFSGCSAIISLYLSENFGRMGGGVSTLDLSALTQWIDSSVQTLLELYNRKANGMSVITIKLSSATKNALGSNGISTLTAKGYTVA